MKLNIRITDDDNIIDWLNFYQTVKTFTMENSEVIITFKHEKQLEDI